MPRYPRLDASFAVHHIVSRFVNREFRLQTEADRAEYLRRAGLALARCDWRILGYALMSSHVHLVCRAGSQPSAALVKSLHTGFALWLNRSRARLGPVFAERHTTVVLDDDRTGPLLAYVHNNPVRAGIVAAAAYSTWTSHRAYLGLEDGPDWLDIEQGLRLSGCAHTAAGRARFNAMVEERAGEPRDAWLAGIVDDARVSIRAALPGVELASPQFRGAVPHVALLRPADAPTLAVPWQGTPDAVVAAVARHLGLSCERVRARGHMHLETSARRLCLLIWTGKLGRRPKEMADHLGIAPSTATYLLFAQPELSAGLAREAEWLAAQLQDGQDEKSLWLSGKP
jgi:REP element-mobilizing transposase RayT